MLRPEKIPFIKVSKPRGSIDIDAFLGQENDSGKKPFHLHCNLGNANNEPEEQEGSNDIQIQCKGTIRIKIDDDSYINFDIEKTAVIEITPPKEY